MQDSGKISAHCTTIQHEERITAIIADLIMESSWTDSLPKILVFITVAPTLW